LKCVASVPGQGDVVIKLLSVDPNNYPDAPVEAIRRVLEKATGNKYPKGQKISLWGCVSFLKKIPEDCNLHLRRIYQDGNDGGY